MLLGGQAERRAADLAVQRKKEEEHREKERQEALKERAATYRAREASRAQVWLCLKLFSIGVFMLVKAALELRVAVLMIYGH